ncbi:ABC transporter permease [Acanthopleuribacter pedis]|uniref:Uncharacterized protein n=1 Tax=Acanthopleuribacter pedis TaxID=442870 RepID=A0A8J7QCB1_9BACT|nr:hypothetical protein [Acanthopleuribacter pedis]MBO1316910.1 hypothetical protein [Acanthopleuribacter pedis]
MIGLARKELRHHALPLALMVTGMSLLALLFFYITYAGANRGNFWERYPMFIMLGSLVATPYLCHRLVSLEYATKTQLFLYSLPLRPATIFATKWFLSLAFLFGCFLPSFLLFAWGVAWIDRMDVTWRQLLFVGGRCAVFVIGFHALNFAFAFLGRYRLAAYGFTALAMLLVSNHWDLDHNQNGPFSLLFHPRFAFDFAEFPWQDALATLAGALVFNLISLGMALTREGSVASMVAIKMTHREKVFFTAIFISTVLSIMLFEEKRTRPPYQIEDAIVRESAGLSIHIGRTTSVAPGDLEQLADWLHTEISALQSFLGMPFVPRINITIRQDLDPDKFEKAYLVGSEGLLVKLAYQPDTWRPERFLQWLVPEILEDYSNYRVYREPSFWLLDGFAPWWVQHRLEGDWETLFEKRAAYAYALGVTQADVDGWIHFRERLGVDLAQAIAYQGVQALVQRSSTQQVEALFQKRLGLYPERDVRAFIREQAHPFPSVFQDHTEVDYAAFRTLWFQRLQETHARRLESIAAIPRLEAEMEVVTLSEKTRRLRFMLQQPQTLEGRLRFYYLRLPRYEWLIDPNERQVIEVPTSQALTGVDIGGTFSKHTRFAWTAAFYSEELQCELLSGWHRTEVP